MVVRLVVLLLPLCIFHISLDLVIGERVVYEWKAIVLVIEGDNL